MNFRIFPSSTARHRVVSRRERRTRRASVMLGIFAAVALATSLFTAPTTAFAASPASLNVTPGASTVATRAPYMWNIGFSANSANTTPGVLTATLTNAQWGSPSANGAQAICTSGLGGTFALINSGSTFTCSNINVASTATALFTPNMFVPSSVTAGSTVSLAVTYTDSNGTVSAPVSSVTVLPTTAYTSKVANSSSGLQTTFTNTINSATPSGTGVSGNGNITITLVTPTAQLCPNATDVYNSPGCVTATAVPYTVSACPASTATAPTETTYDTQNSPSSGASCSPSSGTTPITETWVPNDRIYPSPTNGGSLTTYEYSRAGLTLTIDSTYVSQLRYPSNTNAGTLFCTYTAVSNNSNAPLTTGASGSCGTIAPTPASPILTLGVPAGNPNSTVIRQWGTSVGASKLGVSVANSGTTPYAAGSGYCVKFDNSRDQLVSAVPAPTGGLAQTVEYGVGGWGASSADEAHSSYAQRAANCSGTANGVTWYTAAQIDFTNSGLKTINANQINAIRSTITAPLTAASGRQTLSFGGSLRSLATDTRGVALQPGDIHLYVPQSYDASGTVTTASPGQCSSANTVAQTCPVTAAGPTTITGVEYGQQSSGPMSSTFTFDGTTNANSATNTGGVQTNAVAISGQFMNFTVKATGFNQAPNDVSSNAGSYSTNGITAASVPNVTVTSVFPQGVIVNCAAISPAAATCTSTGSGATIKYTVTWSVSSLAQGATMSYNVPAAMSSLTPTGTYSGTTTVTAPTQVAQATDTSVFSLTNTFVPVPTITKTATASTVNKGDVASWTITTANPTGGTTINSADTVDLFPFSGDTRGTSLAGTYALTGVDTSNASGSTVYVSSVSGATLDLLDGVADGVLDKQSPTAQQTSNLSQINAAFACTIAQVGTAGCPATLAAVTAIEIKGGSGYLAPATSKSVKLSFTTSSLQGGDTVVNTSASQLGVFATITTPNSPIVIASPTWTVVKSTTSATTQPGATVHYTVVFTNTGNQTLPYQTQIPTIVDDLSDVLDDGAAPSNINAGGGTATFSGSTLTWTPASPTTIAPGQTRTLSYDIVVKSGANLGNGVLNNRITDGVTCLANSTAAGCSTSTPVQTYTLTKAVSPSKPHPGDTVTYTVSLKNTGGAFTATTPISFTDNYAGVVDDTSTPATPTVTSGSGTVTTSGSTFTYTSGAMASGQIDTITYTVAVPNPLRTTGDNVLVNTLVNGTDGGSCTTTAAIGCTVTTPVQAFDVTKTANKTVVSATDDTVTYTMTVKNTGTAAYSGLAPDQATFTDDLSSVLNNATVTSGPTVVSGGGAASAISGNSFTYTSGVLAAGASAVISLTVKLKSQLTSNTDLTNEVNTPAGIGGDCPAASTPAHCIVTTSVERADLASVKTLNTAPVVAGGAIRYTLTTTNNGPSAASAVVISDVVPSTIALNSQSATPKGWVITSGTGSCVVTGQTINCTFPTLAVNSAAIVQLNGVVSPTAGGSTISNSMVATAATLDPIASNDCPGAAACTVGTSSTSRAQLKNTKTVNTSPIVAGGPIQWTVSSSNEGPSAAANVVIADTVPNSVTGVAITPSGGGVCSAVVSNAFSCTWSSIGAAGVASVVINGTVLSTAIPNSQITNTAHITDSTACDATQPGYCTDPSVTGTVTTLAALVNTKTLNTSPVVAGGPISFTIQSSNKGPSVAQAVTITDAISSSIENVTATPSSGSCSVVSNTVTCSFGALAVAPASGSSASVLISGNVKATAANGTLITNTAVVNSTTTCDTSYPGACTTPSSPPVTLGTVADLINTKTLDTATIVAGAPIQYTIKSMNQGPSVAQNVVISDTLPASVTNIVPTPSAGGDCSASSGQTVSCTFATLATGATATVTVVALVKSDTPSGLTLTNTATVDSATPCDSTVTGACLNPTAGPNPVTTKAALINTKTLDTNPVVAGGPIQFTVTSHNQGLSDAQAVTISDAIASDITGITAATTGSTTANAGTCTVVGNNVSCTFPTIKVGETASIVIKGTVSTSVANGTSITNTAHVTSLTTCDTLVSGACAAPASTPQPSTDEADLEVDKALTTGTVIAGLPIQYTIRTANVGPSNAQNVVTADPIEAAILNPVGTPDVVAVGGACSTYDSATPAGAALLSTANTLRGTGFTAATHPFVVSCSYPSLAAGDQVVDTVSGTVSPATLSGTAISNGAVAYSATDDPDISNNVSVVSASPNTVADVVISSSASPTSVTIGDTVTLTITVKNNGPSDAANVVVDNLPSGLTLMSSSTVDGSYSGTQWNVGVVPAGHTALLSLVFQTNSTLASNTATLTTSTAPDPAATLTHTSTVFLTVLPKALAFTGTNLLLGGLAGILLFGGIALWIMAALIRRREESNTDPRYFRTAR